MKYNFIKLDEIQQIKNDQFAMINFPNVPFIAGKIPKNIQNYLLIEIERIKNNFDTAKSMTDELAGHIKREYKFENYNNEFEEFILSYSIDYAKINKISPQILDKGLPFTLDNIWINFQKKHEFNPPHTHSGIVSFVIWMKIPYDIEEELKLYDHTNCPQVSTFNFIYTNVIGKVSEIVIPVSKKYEGFICFFPSQLTHYVNPFYTSDDYRISIAGNVCLRTGL